MRGLQKIMTRGPAWDFLKRLSEIGIPVVEVSNLYDLGTNYSVVHINEATIPHDKRRKLKKKLKMLIKDTKAEVVLHINKNKDRYIFLDLPYIIDGRYLLSRIANRELIVPPRPQLKLPGSR